MAALYMQSFGKMGTVRYEELVHQLQRELSYFVLDDIQPFSIKANASVDNHNI